VIDFCTSTHRRQKKLQRLIYRITGLRGRRCSYFVLLLSVPFLASCDVSESSLPVSVGEIPGTYTANYAAGRLEILELSPDKTYTYSFEAKNGGRYVINDTWSFTEDPDHRNPQLILSNYSCPFTQDATCYSTDSTWAKLDTNHYDAGFGLLKHASGPLLIVRCPARNQFYIKQDK
jgi:hypothetical protein